MPCMTHGSDVLNLRGINIPMGGFLDAMQGTIHELLPVIGPVHVHLQRSRKPPLSVFLER